MTTSGQLFDLSNEACSNALLCYQECKVINDENIADFKEILKSTIRKKDFNRPASPDERLQLQGYFIISKEERYSRVPGLSDTRYLALGTKGKWR